MMIKEKQVTVGTSYYATSRLVDPLALSSTGLFSYGDSSVCEKKRGKEYQNG